MLQFEQKAYDCYGDVVINKSLIHKAGFSSRAIPAYVGEWILYNFLEDGELTEVDSLRIKYTKNDTGAMMKVYQKCGILFLACYENT
ncbi:MAG: hypothetical protein HPY74_17435 [Firmicutes bacterium]|nr:hypothetical protein [Bacillota bacterium]